MSRLSFQLLECILLVSVFKGGLAFLPSSSTVRQSLSFASTKTTDAEIGTTMEESSTSIFDGTGPIKVDMNDYNLDLDDIAEQWTANVVPKSQMMPEGIYLGAKNTRDIFDDTVKVQVPRKVGAGLGIELLELAGGREDGLGITIVSGLVEGGCADGSDVRVGDSITKVQILDERGEERASIATECFSYDATVDAIVSLPPAESDTETMVISLKRLRRKPKVKVTFQYPPQMGEEDITLELFSGENLRRSMLVKGVKLNDPLARRFDSGGSGDCGAEGTCATCAVAIVQGGDLLSPPGQTEKQIFERNPRWRMSCRTTVGYGMREGELVVRLSPKQWD